ncbi:molybdopterin-guanine dinucleotide biosynthesis protein B [Acetobacter indonesiensis]|uniref:molybdopterin-guanine dinucleotide biosynthesis protein B n=1 Tax=Acetobacter indonesiensis TaxID=104101 RepID=UPI000A3BF9FE|nr:molybdopterin-guanine dinucleotide biosynthesis protein B [Acetobacter indonesiensis]MCP1231406.1 molybdopterin-guanine dinucleotide biosynthesis protein B [Acetobacter indonesiensis]OUI93938.1 molybdopterin-guanine dinucleotide biosynthesis protein MobB [Acetobacter indonesiensis]
MPSASQQAVIGLVGRSGSGKTHLMARLLPLLKARGLSVSTIKHTHHHIDIDKPGKDSFIHRQAGASEVMLATPERWVLQHSQPNTRPTLPDLLRRMSRVDLIVVEGFHADVPATIEVFRPEVGKDALFHTQTNIIAVATTAPAKIAASLMTLNLDDTSAIAEFALRHAYVFHLD